MAGYVVRKAIKSDMEVVLSMIKELAVFEKELESRVKITTKILTEDGFGSDKWFYCLVSEIQTDKSNEIVGYALYFRTYSTWNGRTMKIEDLYVKPEHRRKGIGCKLLKEMTKEALGQGCVRVHWNVLSWNTNAKDFYRYVGTEISEELQVCTLYEQEMKTFVQK